MCDALAADLCKPIPPSRITLFHGSDDGDDDDDGDDGDDVVSVLQML